MGLIYAIKIFKTDLGVRKRQITYKNRLKRKKMANN